MKGHYTQEEKEEACTVVFALMSEGLSLRKILNDPEKAPIIPSMKTFMKWLAEDDKTEKKRLGEQYTRARQARADSIFEDMLAIADDGTNDIHTVELPGGKEVKKTNKEVVQRSRLRVETRKWFLGKLSGKYADKTKLELGGDPHNKTPIEIDFKGLSK